MGKFLSISFGVLALALLAGCTHHDDSMESMKMGGDNSMSAAPSTMPATMTYTCTMHPDVVSDKSGKCPKCGMALVPKK